MTLPIPKQHSKHATRLTVPEEHIVSVEHPCVVKNVEKAIDTIGGLPGIAQVVQDGSEKTFALSFRPQDPSSRTIIAHKRKANNILLRINVPQRTGRKRKRGTDGPWIEESTETTQKKDARYLVDSMADNLGSYKVTALSAMPAMHIWRSMPDFAYSTSHIKILQDAKSKLLSQQYCTVKDFEIAHTHGTEDTTTLPPPIWSNQHIPQNYTYRQNPSVRVSHDPVTGTSIVGNTQAPPKTYTHQIAWDDVEYPKTVMVGITPLEKQTPINQETVAALRNLFEERPIWSRRALLNCMPSHLSAFNVVRFCLGYVSYAIRSGPWRDTLVRLGIDPRTDPKYRFYQTIMLQLVPKSNQLALAAGVTSRKTNSYKPRSKPGIGAAGPVLDSPTPAQSEKTRLLESRRTFQRKWTGSDSSTSHIFDGQSRLPPDGKVWQLCDFTDPQLVTLRDVAEVHVRAECENRYFGWYENGTNAKIRVALKAKVEALAEGKRLDPELLRNFMLLPEKLGFEVDTEAGTNTAVAYSQQANNQSEAQMRTPMIQTALSTNNLSAYLGDKPSQQQLSWAAAYRAFAKTGLGSVPASGASGKGRLTKSKPEFRKSYLNNENVEETQEVASSNAVQQDINELQDGTTYEQPIQIDRRIDLENSAVIENHSSNLTIDEIEDILPSIEVDGFDIEDDNGSGLELDGDEPDIKMEESEHQTGNQGEGLLVDEGTLTAPDIGGLRTNHRFDQD